METCCSMSTPADSRVALVFARPASGQSDWAGLPGKFPFVGDRFIRKEDVCLYARTCKCDCV